MSSFNTENARRKLGLIALQVLPQSSKVQRLLQRIVKKYLSRVSLSTPTVSDINLCFHDDHQRLLEFVAENYFQVEM